MIRSPEHPRPKAGKRASEAGFTLTEIMVVVFIIGLLSTVVLVNVLGARSNAQVQATRAQLSQTQNALAQYSLEMYQYPTTEQGLEALVTEPAGTPANGQYRRGGYLNRVPSDGWNRPLQYRYPAQDSDREYDLFSLGADGQPGGEEENADISVWDL